MNNGSLATPHPIYGATPTSPIRPPLAIAAIVALAVLGLMLPYFVSSTYYMNLLVRGVILGIGAIGLGFLMQQCGLVMIGVSAFIGLPANLLAIGLGTLKLTTGASVAFAFASTAAFAFLTGALITRAKPLPFAMLTLALAQLLKSVVLLQPLRNIAGGDDGLLMNFNGGLFGLTQEQFASPSAMWRVAWVSLCGAMLVTWWVAQSRFGVLLRGIKANEERMRFCGFSTYLPRIGAFTFACAVMSLSGLLLALNTGLASPDLLDFATGGNALPAMLIGGSSTVVGPLLGALTFIWGQDVFGTTGDLELLTGLAVILVLWMCPDGLIGLLRRATGILKGAR